MSYVPQNKAEIMYNLYSGRKNSIFKKKIFFENFDFCIEGSPHGYFWQRSIFFPKNFFSENDSSGTCKTLKETKSRNLVSETQSTWKQQTICCLGPNAPTCKIGLIFRIHKKTHISFCYRWSYHSFPRRTVDSRHWMSALGGRRARNRRGRWWFWRLPKGSSWSIRWRSVESFINSKRCS